MFWAVICLHYVREGDNKDTRPDSLNHGVIVCYALGWIVSLTGLVLFKIEIRTSQIKESFNHVLGSWWKNIRWVKSGSVYLVQRCSSCVSSSCSLRCWRSGGQQPGDSTAIEVAALEAALGATGGGQSGAQTASLHI